MSITLIVTKSYDENFEQTGQEISLSDWLILVERDAELRLLTYPATLTNSKTNQTISIKPLPGQTEMAVGNQYVPFLRHRSGELVMRFSPDLEDKKNSVRRKIAEVARRLGAIITHDAGDEILKW